MEREAISQLWRLALLMLVGGLLGLPFGLTGWGVAAGTLLFTLRSLRFTSYLLRWLRSDDATPPATRLEERDDLWARIFQLVESHQQQQKRQQQQLEAVVLRSRQSINAIRDGFILLSRNHTLEWWNQAATRLLNLQGASDIGQPITNLLRDPRFVRYYRRSDFGQALELPSPLRPRQILQYQITPFGDGEQILVVRDVTHIHQLEQMRKDFVANVSHEMRTPLTVIRGYLETLMDVVDPEQVQLLRAMERMDQQARRMEFLIADLLTLARLETESIMRQVKPVDVPALIQQIKQESQPLADDKQQTLTLDVEDGLLINGVTKELQSAFSNLVLNAIKYTPPHGQVSIRWWRDDEGIFFEVEDDGIGIEAQHLPRLTERFYRADPSRDAKTGGTGLGLAIVKHVMLNHEGHINISSEPGEGSIFTCQFPMSRLASSAEATLSAEELMAAPDAQRHA